MAKALCENCGREFEAKTKMVEDVRYGVRREREVEETICPDCKEDMDLEDDEDEIDSEDENE